MDMLFGPSVDANATNYEQMKQHDVQVAHYLHCALAVRNQYARQHVRLAALRLQECGLSASGQDILAYMTPMPSRRRVYDLRTTLAANSIEAVRSVIGEAVAHGTQLALGFDDLHIGGMHRDGTSFSID
jgi:hypothetical protein